MRKLACAITLMIILAGLTAHAKSVLHEENVAYQAQGITLKGYLVYDQSIRGARPGVLVVHEWWGLNDFVRERARRLAQSGYTALAVDMYGEGKQADHPADAEKFSSEIMKNPDLERARFMAGYNYLKLQPTVDPARIAAIGYCFGGGVVLQMAREGVDLRGVVSFHGMLSTMSPAKPGAVKARVLVLHGSEDAFTPPDQLEAFKREMKTAGVDYKIIVYPGARHAFTNPDADASAKKFNIPLQYDADADKKSWIDMRSFLNEILQKQKK